MFWQALCRASILTGVHPPMGANQSVPEGPADLLVSSSPPICFSGKQYCSGQPDTLFLKKDYTHSGIRKAFSHWKILLQDPQGTTPFQITMEKEEGLFGHQLVYIRDMNEQVILNLKLPNITDSVIQIRKEGQEDVEEAVLVRKPVFAMHPEVKAYLPGSHKDGKCGEQSDFRASHNKWGFMVYTEKGEEKKAIAQMAYGKDSGVLWLADGADVPLMVAIAMAVDCLNDGGMLYRQKSAATAGPVVVTC